MATCLKRSSSLRELICPVCRTILREPVTLPCAHNLCLRCLQGTVQHNSLTCPLCRQRLGSWLRAATKSESLVNAELWQLIRRSFPRELDQAAAATVQGPTATAGHSANAVDFDAGFIPKKILSAAGEIRREYEIQLQLAQEEMRRQQEKERLASEALIRKLQEDEEREKLMLLAQDQLLAKTLAKRECINKNASATLSVDNKPNQSKPATNQKMSVRKQNVAPISKIRSERYLLNAKTNPANVQKEPQDTFASHKPVPIHNAVTRVVTHQTRLNQPNNSLYSAALGELVGSTSKIYGLQSKEELHVPGDVLSSKKKKLGVEVCITNVEGEERIGSAESAGSHDSINQEIHHFKPIKALPRTPLKVTDGRQYDPKLIRVLAKYKKITNAVPKPPVQTHSKKTFGCSWSAFKRISKQQVLQKESVNIYQETKKTDRKLELSQTATKLSKFAPDVEETIKRRRNVELSYDSNDNYTKKIVNGTKVSKKLNMDEQYEMKPNKRAGKVKNGLILGKSNKSTKVIEVVDIEDDEPSPDPPSVNSTSKTKTPDPLAFTPKNDTRQPSPVWETAIENIAERIKRRKTSRTISNTENIQSAINLVKPAAKPKNPKPAKKPSKPKSKKPSSTASKTAATKAAKAKTKTKTPKTTTITSQIKRLAARSSKRPRYTEDSESEPEDIIESPVVEPKSAPEPVKQSEPEKPAAPSPSPRKKPRKNAKPRRNKPKSPDDDSIVKEQERLEQLAAQERKDLELAMQLQAQFDAMGRATVRTRRGAANKPITPVLTERRPQKRALVE